MACLSGCAEEKAAPLAEAKATPVSAAPTVLVDRVTQAPWPRTVRVQGSLFGDEQAVVGVKVAGRIKEVLVDLGSVVRQGDILSRLEDEDFRLRVKQADAQLTQSRAALGLSPEEPDSQLDRLKSPPVRQEKALLDQAQFEFDRAQRLVQQKIVTVEEMQQKEAALNVAKARYSASLNSVDEKIALLAVRRAELELAKRQEIDSVTLAPFDGIVQQRHVAPGVYVNVGAAIVTLVRTNPLRFNAGVPERQAMEVGIGQLVHIRVVGLDPEAERQLRELQLEVDSLDEAKHQQRLNVLEKKRRELEARLTVQATVKRISPALELSSRTLLIEAEVPNPAGKVRTGLFAEGEIVVDSSDEVLSVPVDAVSEFAGVEKVWIVTDSVAKEVRIRTGRRYDGRAEIVEVFDAVELKQGDQVIASAEQGHTGEVVVAAAVSASARGPSYQLGAGE
jgi:RND family efflux transporter MFP subunit